MRARRHGVYTQECLRKLLRPRLNVARQIERRAGQVRQHDRRHAEEVALLIEQQRPGRRNVCRLDELQLAVFENDVLRSVAGLAARKAAKRHLEPRPVRPLNVENVNARADATTQLARSYQPSAGRQLLHEPGEAARFRAAGRHVTPRWVDIRSRGCLRPDARPRRPRAEGRPPSARRHGPPRPWAPSPRR
jgi:hypothetical protein